MKDQLEKLRQAIHELDHNEMRHPACYVVQAARDLLNAEPDEDVALPPGFAEAVAKVNPDMSWPTSLDIKRDSNGHAVPRLSTPRPVEITDWPKPTLDGADERRPKIVFRKGIDKLRVLCRVGPSAHEVDDRGEPLPVATSLGDEPSEWYIFDADPIRPKTVGELEPGMIWEYEGKPHLLCTSSPMAVPMHGGGYMFPAKDTPVTGPIRRWEVGDE